LFLQLTLPDKSYIIAFITVVRMRRHLVHALNIKLEAVPEVNNVVLSRSNPIIEINQILCKSLNYKLLFIYTLWLTFTRYHQFKLRVEERSLLGLIELSELVCLGLLVQSEFKQEAVSCQHGHDYAIEW
jgi:hypothetical protein